MHLLPSGMPSQIDHCGGTPAYPNAAMQGKKQRTTICVSSQVGCAMNCQFCYTGRMGLLRNLEPSQIVEQLVEARRYLAACADLPPASNIVFMGMGAHLSGYHSTPMCNDFDD